MTAALLDTSPFIVRTRGSDEWYTPPEIFAAIDLDFDLDPASPENGPVPWVPARRFLTRLEDGLTSRWRGRVWLNPPYGRRVGLWVNRLIEHGDGVALTFARTDTPWFQRAADNADLVLLVRGRIRFVAFDRVTRRHNCGSPSVLLAYGRPAARKVAASGLGVVVRA